VDPPVNETEVRATCLATQQVQVIWGVSLGSTRKAEAAFADAAGRFVDLIQLNSIG
jgi:hypothetical protein